MDFSPIVAHHIVYLSDAGHKNTNANSSFGGKYIGAENEIVVGTEASVETLISFGLITTSQKSWTNISVGIPNSTVLNWTVNFAVSSLDAK